jgi:uncharacterized protein (AIM24 family)
MMADVYTCPWCRAVSDAGTASCPNCGAPVDITRATTESGWIELPPIKDMARIQFGHSTCQIEGMYVPVADMNLAEGDGVYFNHHVLLWMEPNVRIGAMPMNGAWKRMKAEMPLVMMESFGPGHIAFSEDRPGELIALPLDPGQAIDVREHHFLVATHSVTYDWFQTNIWFRTRDGDDTETHYPLGQYMDRFSTPTDPGLLLIHAGGNTFLRMLGVGETILIKPTALLFKDPTVESWLHFEHPGNQIRTWRAWGNRYLWLAVRGPGRVAVQSAYARLADPGTNLVNASTNTKHQW